MTSLDGLEEYQPHVRGKTFESDSIESKISFIYQEAVEDFKNIFDTEFRPPNLGFEQPVIETYEGKSFEPGVENYETEKQEVGYSIEDETNDIILNKEILGELHPDLLMQDFRYILKRYHDISLQKSFEKDVIPYVKSLQEENELSVESIYFTDIEDGQADYNNDKQRIRVDYPRLKNFNPETGKFESNQSLPGVSIKLHELVHDLDFTNNQHTRNYSLALDDIDTMDPRNAVLEAPTTFEVYMAGWETRENALAAFKDPLLNHDFFDDYPALDVEEGESGTIQDPYNMGLITSLSLHDAMIGIHGVEEGTKKTRNILYKNFWDLQKMGRVLEAATEQRDVPNIPRHKREMQEIARSENVGEIAAKQAKDILDGLGSTEEPRELLWLNTQGSDLIKAYEKKNSFADAPGPLEDLDRKLVDLKQESEK